VELPGGTAYGRIGDFARKDFPKQPDRIVGLRLGKQVSLAHVPKQAPSLKVCLKANSELNRDEKPPNAPNAKRQTPNVER
jgi:hypothetical protein